MSSRWFQNRDSLASTFVLACVLSLLVVSVTGPALALQTNQTNQTTANTPTQTSTATSTSTTTTSTATSTSTEASCEPGDSEPQMDQARLYASDSTIESGSPGRIAGGFQVDPTANCPVVVYVTMSVPSGMTISGGSDFSSGGAGMVAARFTVRPGANIKDVSANVYSDEPGQKSVTANIQYWPEGHEDLSRDVDGLTFNFDIEEATTPTATGQNGGSSNGLGPVLSSNVLVIGALLIVTLLAIGARL